MFPIGRGHLRLLIRNIRRHRDNQRVGVVFVSLISGSKNIVLTLDFCMLYKGAFWITIRN